MPEEIRYDANATPPQFTNNADMVIEPGTQIRVKIQGTRTEVGEMWAIGTIHGDFLGYALYHQTNYLPVFNLTITDASKLSDAELTDWAVCSTPPLARGLSMQRCFMHLGHCAC
jgi:hypothetical protein